MVRSIMIAISVITYIIAALLKVRVVNHFHARETTLRRKE